MNENQKQDLLTCSRTELEELLQARGKRAFHGRQLDAWIWRKGVFEIDEMTDLSKELRASLRDEFEVKVPKIVEVVTGEGENSATKYLFELSDGARVEAVYIPSEDRVTVCLSSQVGCAFGCKFCATGLLGLARNMTTAEIMGTFLMIRANSEKRISNVVFMGMGEPLANLKPVTEAWDRLTDPDGIGLSRRKVTISTVGLPPKIRLLAEREYPPKLVFSICSADEERRRELLPVAGRFTLDENYEALMDYANRTRNRITVAYLVADGLNDTIEEARKLDRWLRDLPAKINMLRYNEAVGDFRRPSEEKVEEVAAELVRLGRTVVLRTSRGRDIAAACGQLAARQITKQKSEDSIE
ncbi:23S rRNA (adenine(2503)-C(2))-methyltransferase RlmN [bacterium]|nr:23S rRNA (adenine(2503)-C(2))-methyltransferase RlmN [bacterium]